MTPRLGTDGKRIVYPIRGIAQGVRDVSGAQPRTTVYVASLAIGASATAVALLMAGYALVASVTALVLGAAAAAAERGNVRITNAIELSLSQSPTLFAAVLFGPLAAGVVGAASMLGDPELLSPSDRDRAPR